MFLKVNKIVQNFNLIVYSSPKRPLSADMSEWNPFGDDNFGELSEDSMFGHEFDRLRRGSNSSESVVSVPMVLSRHLLIVKSIIL